MINMLFVNRKSITKPYIQAPLILDILDVESPFAGPNPFLRQIIVMAYAVETSLNKMTHGLSVPIWCSGG